MIHRVQLSDFDEGSWVDYAADDIQIVNDIRQIEPRYEYPVTLDLAIIVFCLQGKFTVTVDDERQLVRMGQVLFLQPNSTISGHQLSPDLNAKALIFSPRIIEDSIYMRRKIWDNITYLHQYPVQTLTRSQTQLLWHYYEIATTNISEADSAYKREIIGHLLRSLVYEFLLMTDSLAAEEAQAPQRGFHQQQNDDLHRRFLSLLGYSRGRIRQVSQFADRLCVTPDQLTAAVKAVSGRTASEWIAESVIKEISHQLLYTSKPVKEIADDLDFPSLSFFGKYFRQHTGLSPRQYRNQQAYCTNPCRGALVDCR